MSFPVHPGPPDQPGPSTPRPKKKRGLVLLLVGVLVLALGVVAFVLLRDGSDPDIGPAPVKPVVYLYPEQPLDVTVQLSHAERLTAEYPAYGDGWHVMAQPDGTLVDHRTGRELYALYYEGGRQTPAQRTDEGFVVPGAQTATFLEWALAEVGLSEREANEFIIYWLPILQENPYTYIRFETLAEQAEVHELMVTPAPDVLIRVMMDWQRLEVPVAVTAQELTAPERHGFVVVEWGGTKIP